jgi:hypothetical protein
MKNFLILGAMIALLASVVPRTAWSQTQVVVSVQESLGGCELVTDCDNDVICVDIVMTFLQTNSLSAYNIWVSYDGDVISREAWNSNNAMPIGDNACELANAAQDTDQENEEDNPDFWRVAADAGLAFPMTANVPVIHHTICFIIQDPAALDGQQICVGGFWEGLIPSTVAFGDGSEDDEDIPVACMTLGADFESCSLLPVELLSFNAERQGSSAWLTWNTASEFNASHFEVQRAGEDKTFVSIGRVEAKGTTTELQSYTFRDEAPLLGTNFYRLRQVDTDGASSNSMIRSVVFDQGLRGMQVYPNPTRSKIAIVLDRPVSQCDFALVDIEGRVVLRHHADGQLAVHQLDVAHLPTGVYQLIATGPTQQWMERIVITD